MRPTLTISVYQSIQNYPCHFWNDMTGLVMGIDHFLTDAVLPNYGKPFTSQVAYGPLVSGSGAIGLGFEIKWSLELNQPSYLFNLFTFIFGMFGSSELQILVSWYGNRKYNNSRNQTTSINWINELLSSVRSSEQMRRSVASASH